MLKTIILIIIILSSSLVLINCLNFCGDWDQYKGIKCIKVVKKKDTQTRAVAECLRLDNSSTLITIEGKEEQEFINRLVRKSANISMFAWIGMKYNGVEYDWTDGTDSEFTNWSDEALKSGEDSCVKMSLMSSMLGKWVDSNCNRRALIVCQRSPELNLNSLKDIIQTISKILANHQDETRELRDKLNLMIPLGFLYTQLPNQTSPQQLWPTMKWTEITQQYSGLFFRAEGKGSEQFGQIQQANQSIISNVKTQGFNSEFETVPIKDNTYKINEKWNLYTDNQDGLRSIGFYVTGGDVRPINTAIRIWKRVG